MQVFWEDEAQVKTILKTLIIISCAQLAMPAVAAEAGNNALERMFAWWNKAIQQPDGFTEAAFRRYFTEDAAIVVNRKERVRGIGPMVKHFKRIQASVDYVEIILPFEEGFESGDRIFTYHRIRAREGGVESLSHVMGYAVVENGRISLVDFLSYDEPADKPAGKAAQ